MTPTSGLDHSALEKNCRIQNGSWLTLKLPKMNLSDVDITKSIIPFLTTLLESYEGKELWANIDLAENPLTSLGCAQLLDALRKYSLRLKTLKLYKCQLTDDGGIAIADFIASQREPVQEMHLSHNRLTVVSFVALLCAVHRHGGYPHGAQKQTPLWARLEYNQVARPGEVLKMVEQEIGVRCCLATDRDSCGPWRCVLNESSGAAAPMIHMFAVVVQKPSMTKSDYDAITVMKLISRFSHLSRVKVSPSESKVAQRASARSVGGTSVWNCRRNGSTIDTLAESSPKISLNVGSGSPVTASDESKHEDSQSSPNSSSDLKAYEPSEARPKCSSVSNVDLALLRYQFEDSALILQCFACNNFHGKEADNVRMVLTMNCSHIFCSECFAAAVRSNIDTVDIKCGSKQVPCPLCKTLMKRSEAAVLEESDWDILYERATLAQREILARQAMTEKLNGEARPQERRIFKEQIETSEPLCINSFLCHFCQTIALDPLITVCSHVYCKACFQTWVAEEVRQYKLEHPDTINVPAIPCPYPDCARNLRKQDVGTLDSSDPGNKSDNSAFSMIRRMRNNMQVRCLHHPSHYDLPFGVKANRLSSEITCSWIGDLNEYALHMSKCEVEMVSDLEGKPRKSKRRKEIRKAVYSFSAEGDGQLTLNAGDLVEVLETCEAGWAAGRRVDSRGTVLSDAGWFPMTFLLPLAAST